MTVDQVVALRTLYHSIKHTSIIYDANTNKPETEDNGNPVTEIRPSSIIVVTNNNFGCNEQENEMWWDDTNQLLYYLENNKSERTSTTVEFGDKIHVPVKFSCLDYSDIQVMTILVGEDTLDQILTAMKGISGVTPAASVTTAARDMIYTKYFKEYADMSYNTNKYKVSGYGV